jgi:hypothetical protein
MTSANDALRRSDDALKRIEALEDDLARALRRINALEALASTASADVDEIAISLGEPIP